MTEAEFKASLAKGIEDAVKQGSAKKTFKAIYRAAKREHLKRCLDGRTWHERLFFRLGWYASALLARLTWAR